jgi:anti-sigma factor RsiW
MTPRDTNPHETPDRQTVEELLPWYAAGTLDRAETAQVEAALAGDPVLRDHLALVREELDETVRHNEARGMPSSRTLEDLFAKIDAEPARKPSMRRRLFDLGGMLADRLSPRTLGWAATAAMLLVAVQLAFDFKPATESGNRYSTANKDEKPAAAGTFLLVAFQTNAGAGMITAALADTKAVIVDGPRPGGLYKLRVGPADLSDADIARLFDAFSARKDVFRLVLRTGD